MQRVRSAERSVPETGGRRRWRLVAPALTPLSAGDLWAGAIGQFRGTGRDRFRNAIESFLDADSSGTQTSFRRTLGACFETLRAAGGDGRQRVLIPAFCSSDFPDAIAGVGLEPVRYDVDPATLCLEEASLEAGLETEPLAVVAVNVLGYGSPMAELQQRCEAADTYLVEAIGYALGTCYRGDRLGTFGDCAVLNFQQGKPIPVGGGMVVSQNPTLEFRDEGRPVIGPNAGALAGYAALSRPRPYYWYQRLKDRLADVGISGRVTTHPESKTGVDYADPYATMSNFQGAIGRRVLDRLEAHQRVRAATANYYRDNLAGEPHITLLESVEGLAPLQHVRFPIRLSTTGLRDAVKVALRERGIQATTLYDWPVIDPEEFHGAARIQRTIVTQPTHPYVDEQDRQSIVATVRETIARYAEADRELSTTEQDPDGIGVPAE